MRFVTILAAWAAITLAPPAAARDLTIATDADSLVDPLKKTLLAPFTEATGHPVAIVPYAGTLAALRDQIGRQTAGGETGFDIAVVREADLAPACDQGYLEKLDWGAIGGRDRLLPQGVFECGMGAFMRSTVLAWDRDKFPAAPAWSDFWDIAKYPGKRGLFHGALGNLEIALLADGVAPGDVYGTLRGNDGVDRAFRKLDQLKPYVVWWTDPAQPSRILGSGDVLMTSAPNASVTAADRTGQRNFGIQWAGSLYSVACWAVLKASPNLADAKSFLLYAGDPVRQAALLPLIAYGPLARGANDRLPAELVAVSPSAPANLANALHIDPAFWRDNAAKLDARFEDWLKH